jgi:Protein of unknown function (DUF3179)
MKLSRLRQAQANIHLMVLRNIRFYSNRHPTFEYIINEMKGLFFIVGMALLIGSEILRIYLIMPFPGSQEDESVAMAYFLHQNIGYFRIVGIIMVAYPTYLFFKAGSQTIKIMVSILLAFYAVVFYSSNFQLVAERIFVQPEYKTFVTVLANKVPEKKLVLGVAMGDQAKAYPIEVIGYHHQVLDTIAGTPIMVTYCTVCRTGRVYSPEVNGKMEEFRLVGMDHFNAMFEDRTTGSWWRQVNGQAIVGPLRGTMLKEIPSEQMSLAAWIALHPDTRILQPDTLFNEGYKELEKYDEGKMTGRLESKDSLSWKDKSWVVGVQIGLRARAYDWIELQQARMIEDTLNSLPLLVLVEPDSASFHVFSRILELDTLSFSMGNNGTNFQDVKTKSLWSWNGRCIEGELKGSRLTIVQSYQEYWHSWRMFRGKNAYHRSP